MNQVDEKYRYLVLFLLGIFPFLINGYLNPKIASVPALYWCFELTVWVALPCLIFYLLVSKHSLALYEIGCVNPFLSFKDGLKFLGICLLVMILTSFLYKESFLFFYNIAPGEAIFTYQSVIPESGIKRVIAVWYFAITAGVVEELYFRGLLYKVSELFGSPWVLYVLFSPIAFSLIHWEGNLANMGATYVLGVIGCLLFLWLKNIWPIIIGHIYSDLLLFH